MLSFEGSERRTLTFISRILSSVLDEQLALVSPGGGGDSSNQYPQRQGENPDN